MTFNIIHSIQATPAQIEALAALDLTLNDCAQKESGTLLAALVENDRVREYWIAEHGGIDVYEMRGKLVNITDEFFAGKGRLK